MPPLNYSKWDSLDAGSDDEGGGPDASPAAELAQSLLSEWIREAVPDIDAGDSLRLIDFVNVALPRMNHSDNLPRAAEIIAFLERHSPSAAVLLDVLWGCRAKDEDVTDASERMRIMKLRGALFSALNTLESIASFGGARQLFDALAADPEARHKPLSPSRHPAPRSLPVCAVCARAAPSKVRDQRDGERAVQPALPGRH